MKRLAIKGLGSGLMSFEGIVNLTYVRATASRKVGTMPSERHEEIV